MILKLMAWTIVLFPFVLLLVAAGLKIALISLGVTGYLVLFIIALDRLGND